MRDKTPVFIHVGFCNTGTTSLQQNFFSTRDDIFFAGEPYRERGGIFTAIKSSENFRFDTEYYDNLCHKYIYSKNNGLPVVISDETLCDTPQLYSGPYTMPRDVIAHRLHYFFPSAKIIFTIRDQRHYAMSAYFNLKRNTAYFDNMPMPTFSDWLSAMLSRERTIFLQNLNFVEAIGLYSKIFGKNNVCVLPLEMLVADGTEAYLGRLCDFTGLQFSQNDVAKYHEIRNRRMSKRRETVGELLHDPRFRQFFADLVEHIGAERLNPFLDAGPHAAIQMPWEDEEKIRRRVGIGNWLLAKEFDLDLKRYGYLTSGDQDFTTRQLDMARQDLEYRTDTDRFTRDPLGQEALALRQSVELEKLRSLAMELMTVRESPVWRTVERLDRARRFLLRATPLGQTRL